MFQMVHGSDQSVWPGPEIAILETMRLVGPFIRSLIEALLSVLCNVIAVHVFQSHSLFFIEICAHWFPPRQKFIQLFPGVVVSFETPLPVVYASKIRVVH